ncbi:13020_t:CDS:2, partial [Racocetra persica]
YLTKLTDHQICLISENDLESFDWIVEDDSDEEAEGSSVVEFKVLKTYLPSEIMREINVDNADCPLPFIIESTLYQAFVIVKK